MAHFPFPKKNDGPGGQMSNFNPYVLENLPGLLGSAYPGNQGNLCNFLHSWAKLNSPDLPLRKCHNPEKLKITFWLGAGPNFF